jgi:hypothetical protein
VSETFVAAGRGWREGTHNGTLAGPEGLTLIPGVSRGVWRRRFEAEASFDRLVASLCPSPWPVGSGARLSARVRSPAGWKDWACLGVYGEAEDLPRSDPEAADVAVDLLRVGAGATELDVRLEVEAGPLGGSPQLRRLALEAWTTGSLLPEGTATRSPAWGRILDVPERSQQVEDPTLAARICSPTSLAMVLEFLGVSLPTAEVAAAVRDRAADLYGNWSFNVAFAAEHGHPATVRRLTSLADLEAEIEAGRPAVISHRYEAGQLSGAPLPRTDGHLAVVVGFSEAGDVVVNDPAADPSQGEAVRRVYPRAELAAAWLERADGVAYLFS